MTNFGGVLMASIRRYHPSVADDLSAATGYYDEIVAGGGHAISMTHGPQVNEFLRKHISQITTT